ncbi:hypothetical protein Tco_0405582 [Tanacetum coccineum]
MQSLNQPLPPAPEAGVEPNIVALWTALYDAHTEIACLMLRTGVEKFDLIQSFHACKQEEGKPVADYVLKMKGYVEAMERGSEILEKGTFMCILAELQKKGAKLALAQFFGIKKELLIKELFSCTWAHGVRAKVEALEVLTSGDVRSVKRDTLTNSTQRSVKCIFIGYQRNMGTIFYLPPENKIVVARYDESLRSVLISLRIRGEGGVDLEEFQEEEDTNTFCNH